MLGAGCLNGTGLLFETTNTRVVPLRFALEAPSGRRLYAEILVALPSGLSASKASGSRSYTIKTEGK
jgi:hypothetical protein